MPQAPPHPCSYPGCTTLVTGVRCGKHATSSERRDWTRMYQNARWRRARLRFLREHPLCQCDDCQEGKVRLREATVVDHRVPHRGDEELFWNQDNWRALAKACHDLKTGRESSARRAEHRLVEGR